MVYIIPCRNLNHFISIILLNHFWHRFILVAATTAAAIIDVLCFSHSQKFFSVQTDHVSIADVLRSRPSVRWKCWSHVKLLHSFVCHHHRIHWMALSQCIFYTLIQFPTCTLSQTSSVATLFGLIARKSNHLATDCYFLSTFLLFYRLTPHEALIARCLKTISMSMQTGIEWNSQANINWMNNDETILIKEQSLPQ